MRIQWMVLAALLPFAASGATVQPVELIDFGKIDTSWKATGSTDGTKSLEGNNVSTTGSFAWDSPGFEHIDITVVGGMLSYTVSTKNDSETVGIASVYPGSGVAIGLFSNAGGNAQDPHIKLQNLSVNGESFAPVYQVTGRNDFFGICFTDLAGSGAAQSISFDLFMNGGHSLGDSVSFAVEGMAAVPEPSSLALILLGTLAIIFLRSS